LAAQVITAYVNKKRKQENNLLLQATKPSEPVEVGAVWSTPQAPETGGKPAEKRVSTGKAPAATAGGAKSVAARWLRLTGRTTVRFGLIRRRVSRVRRRLRVLRGDISFAGFEFGEWGGFA